MINNKKTDGSLNIKVPFSDKVKTTYGKFRGYCKGREGLGVDTCGLFLNTDEKICPKCGGTEICDNAPTSKEINSSSNPIRW